MEPSALQVVAEAYERFNRYDWNGLADLIDPHIRATDRQAPIDVIDELEGRAAYIKGCRSWIETFDDAHIEVERSIADGDRVISVAHYCGQGAVSGAVTRQLQVDVFTVAAGRIVRAELGFASVEEARAATAAVDRPAAAPE